MVRGVDDASFRALPIITYNNCNTLELGMGNIIVIAKKALLSSPFCHRARRDYALH